MPVTHLACPPGKPTYGESHEPKHCIVECTHRCMSPFLIAAIVSSNQKNHHKGRYVSATSLDGCVRKLQAERTLNYADYLDKMYYAFRGTMTHTVVENAVSVDLGGGHSLESLGFLSEWRMQIGFCFEHGGFSISSDADADDVATWAQHGCPGCDEAGIPRNKQTWFIMGGTLDGTEPDWASFDPEEGTLLVVLHDLKTMQEYAVGYMVKGDPKNTLHPQIKDAYVKQANVYRYLGEKSEPPEALRKKGVKRLKFVVSHIQAFAMGEAPWTGGGTYRWKDHWKNPLKDWPMYPVEFFDDKWCEEYIATNGRPIYDSLITGEKRGTICDPDESKKKTHSWKCDFCAFYASSVCPNPALEYDAIQKGMDAEAAFEAALASPAVVVEEKAGKLTDDDTLNVTNFHRKKAGLTPTAKEKKPRAKKGAK